jgi:hypothetical protein
MDNKPDSEKIWPCVGGPWDGQLYASHSGNRFSVHLLGGYTLVETHCYELITNPNHNNYWMYVGTL